MLTKKTINNLARMTVMLIMSLLPIGVNKNIAFAQPEGTTIRVASNGNDITTCGTESQPCQSIQYAVNKSVSGDTILVAGGSYTYKSNVDTCSFLVTRAVVCVLDKNLTIMGGYTTGNWITSDPVTNLTVIDGTNSVRGVAVIAYNTTATLIMEGFTIQNGRAQGASSGDDFHTFAFGGGLWSQKGGITLRNVDFKNNRAVGGNTGNQYGGAGSGGGLAIQSVKNGALSVLENVSFDGNQSLGGTGTRRGGFALGGALFLYEAPLNGTNVNFTNNIAQAGSSPGDGKDTIMNLPADALGGAVSIQSNSNVNLTNVIVTGNQVRGGNANSTTDALAGGGFGGAIHVEGAILTLTQANLFNNSAVGGVATKGGIAMGGGLMSDYSTLSMNRVRIINNIVSSGGSSTGGAVGDAAGGGAYIVAFQYSSRHYVANIDNVIVADNKLDVGSPGIMEGGCGAGMVIQAMTANIRHSTFSNNQFLDNVGLGQALMVYSLYGIGGEPGVANIDYSIIADHINPFTSDSSALTVGQGSTVNFQDGLFANNTHNTNLEVNIYPVGTITGLDTMMNVPSAGFISIGAPDYNYDLSPSSPAIDNALGSTMTIDIDGDIRPVGDQPDIGADEFTALTLLAQPDLISLIADNNTNISYNVLVDTAPRSALTWTASTSASWVYLGAQGTLHQSNGQAGEELIIRFAPDILDNGIHEAVIEVTGDGVTPTTITVRLTKVDQVYSVFLPLTIR